jgi:class 3 adenylate cyclase
LEKQREQLRQALGTTVAPQMLERLLSNPASVVVEPSGQVVTVMFVDIVGFSLTAERQSARQAFLSLQATLDWIARLVHEHGGVVDKSTGDGILCFFGYHFDGKPGTPRHADDALRCALAIQRRAVTEKNVASSQTGFPLRIGINTAGVYIGNVGGPQRVEMTVIGHGVNLAKRFESACETFSVLIGAATRDLLVDTESLGVKPVRRWLQIKHYPELVEAYECDPFAAGDRVRQEALSEYRRWAGIERKDQRWVVPTGQPWLVRSSLGEGRVINFSASGLCLQWNRYLGRGVTLDLAFGGALGEQLAAQGFSSILTEVRWGAHQPDGSALLGVATRSLTALQRKNVLTVLRHSLNPSSGYVSKIRRRSKSYHPLKKIHKGK